MRVIRAPLRISLFGGGTDLPSYYQKHGCTIISFAINRHIYLVWNERPTGGCRLSYSEVEELETLREAKHTLVRAAAERYGIEEPCTLTIVSDLPKGTGLGSSSALAVCLCKLGEASGAYLDAHAFILEQSVSPRVGVQDHLPAVYGGFRGYEIQKNGKVMVSERLDSYNIREYGLLLYTGLNREANEQLKQWDGAKPLDDIRILAERVADEPQWRWSAGYLGDMLHKTWQLKSSIPGVYAEGIWGQYGAAMDTGALGGKLCGAGGGGCWFFLVPPESRQDVIDALGLVEIPFQVAEKGVEEWQI